MDSLISRRRFDAFTFPCTSTCCMPITESKNLESSAVLIIVIGGNSSDVVTRAQPEPKKRQLRTFAFRCHV